MTAAPSSGPIPPERLALVARTLQIGPDAWRAILDAVAARLAPAAPGEDGDGEIARCLAALAPAYRARSPHEAAAPGARPATICAACSEPAVRPFIARRSPPPDADLVYGRCDRCGHGALLDAPGDAALRARYASSDYFQRRDERGAGYDRYADEEAYRVRKATRLMARLQRLTGPAIATLLEVGSGYGFTRLAAARAGIHTAGVDVSAHAVAEAARRYDLGTFQGTLAEALSAPRSGVARAGFDAVLYQFVLEHVADPVGELAQAREALVPGGWLIALVPSMEATEIAAFGASYRSFRADHLHLFSRASVATALARAGFRPHEVDSHCNLHLLGDLLSAPALDHLYRTGRGPDLFVLARRQP